MIWAIARGKQRMTVLVMEEQQGGTAEHDWNFHHSMSGICPSIREKADSSFSGRKDLRWLCERIKRHVGEGNESEKHSENWTDTAHGMVECPKDPDGEGRKVTKQWKGMPRLQKKKGLVHVGLGKSKVSAQQSISVRLKASSVLSKKWRSIASTPSKISQQSPL